eukprot:354830-Chlamydomonas_euryale.AAC.4
MTDSGLSGVPLGLKLSVSGSTSGSSLSGSATGSPSVPEVRGCEKCGPDACGPECVESRLGGEDTCVVVTQQLRQTACFKPVGGASGGSAGSGQTVSGRERKRLPSHLLHACAALPTCNLIHTWCPPVRPLPAALLVHACRQSARHLSSPICPCTDITPSARVTPGARLPALSPVHLCSAPSQPLSTSALLNHAAHQLMPSCGVCECVCHSTHAHTHTHTTMWM